MQNRFILYRYENKKNLNDLYTLLAAKIFQKKAHEAERTVNQILAKDSLNGNAHAAKMIIKIYRFKLWKQKFNLSSKINK